MIGADDISRLLAEHYPLRLVVLNACDTGRGSALDTFSSTAVALIRRAIPAVVAMQFEITDVAAIRFAQAFYEYVATGRPIDDSVMRARRALRRAKNDTLEWGTPVLYLRAPDARIFDATSPSPAQPGLSSGQAALAAEAATSSAPPSALLRIRPFRSAVQILRHRKAVNAVAFSPDGRQLATACGDKIAWVWDASSGQELARVTHDNWVHGVAFSPDGRRLATAGKDKTARIWALSDDE